MRQFIHWALVSSIFLFGLTSFANAYLPFFDQEQLTSFFGLCMFIFALIHLPVRKKMLPFSIVLLAVLIQLIYMEEPLAQVLWDGLRRMESLIALLIVVPMVGWILAEEPYIEALVAFFSKALYTSKRFYLWVMSITQLVSYFLLFGSIPLVYQFVQRIVGTRQGESWDYFKSTAISRGFALSACWVISMPSFAVAIDSMGASLGLAIIQGFFLSTVGIGLAILFFIFRERKHLTGLNEGIRQEIKRVMPSEADSKYFRRLVLEFICLFFSLFGMVLLLNYLLDWNLLRIIPLVVFCWTLGYYVIKRKLNVMADKGKQYISAGLITRAPEMTILLAAGVLIHALQVSGIGYALVELLFKLTTYVPLLNPLMILPFVLVILGFIGLGPLTVMVLVGGILQSIHLPYPPELIVLTLTLGSAISMIISPLVIPIIVLSGSNGLSVVKNGLKYNLIYACFLYLLAQIYIQGVVWLFGY